jgi:hypothetical protein
MPIEVRPGGNAVSTRLAQSLSAFMPIEVRPGGNITLTRLFKLPLAIALLIALSGRAVFGTPDISIVSIALKLFLMNSKSSSSIADPLTASERMSEYEIE